MVCTKPAATSAFAGSPECRPTVPMWSILTFVRDCFEQPFTAARRAASWFPGEITPALRSESGATLRRDVPRSDPRPDSVFDAVRFATGVNRGSPLRYYTDGMEGIVSISRQH